MLPSTDEVLMSEAVQKVLSDVGRTRAASMVRTSIDQLRTLKQARLETLSEAIRRARSSVNVGDLQGSDPWADVRDPSTGRDVDLD